MKRQQALVNGTGDELALGWAGRVCVAANRQGQLITYYNLGIRRDTSRDILQRWALECRLRLPSDCDGRVVLSCGINDTVLEGAAPRVCLAESTANVSAILEASQPHQILLIGPPPVADDSHNQRLGALTEAYAGVAAHLGVKFIDLFGALVGDSDYRADIANADGFHPSSCGYQQIAQVVMASPHWWFQAGST